MTLQEISDKLKEAIENIQKETDIYTTISVIAEIKWSDGGMTGSTSFSHNGDYLRSEIIANHEEEKMWNES